MNARQLIFTVLLLGALGYFVVKFIPTFERLAESGASVLIVLLILLVLGMLIYRVIAD